MATLDNITSLEGYDIVEKIGEGGFSKVYRATQTSIGREVALKIIHPELANKPDFIRRFELEAQVVSRLEHLHIVPLYDYWRDPHGAYLIMRLIRGGSLNDALTKGAFDLQDTARMLDQLVSALAMAHRNGIIHRDLKPANILLDEEGNAFLTDFGIAKDIQIVDGKQTAPDVIIGSLDYISPEQARSEPVTSATDIYSLGVLLYETLTGEHPFPNLRSIERMYKHLNDPLPLIVCFTDEINDAINEIIQKATEKNPAKRYADVTEIAKLFRKAIASDETPSLEAQLTLREHEILNLIAEGNTNREIAQTLFVTVGTVKWYVRQIYQKLHVRSRVQAIIRARELDLITPDSEGDVSLALGEHTRNLPEPENPYKGLRAFQTADARDFFGREKLIHKLVHRMAEKHQLSRFLAVIGPSGSGKSSLVRAGFVPALWRGELDGSENWYIIDMIPGAHPLDELEIALTRIAADQGTNLHENLNRDARGLVRSANLILPNDNSELVVIVDQLEEVFTLVEDETKRIHFLNLLYNATTDSRSRVRIIVTLRADFYDRPLHYAEFGELIRSRMETVLPLSAEDLEAAITKPASQIGVTFEEGLVAQIIADVHYQPGALPLLQYALTELFEQRSERLMTHEAYEALGGAVGALAKRADDIYTEQDTRGRNLIRQMFMRLVIPGDEGVDTRRRVMRSELLDIADNQDLMDDIIDTFADYRLLTLDHDPATRKSTVEVAHEAILQEWERLNTWLTENRYDILQQRLLSAEAAQWRQGNFDSSYLLHGARLEQFAAWSKETNLALTVEERNFLETSIKTDQAKIQQEKERQQRELDTQRQLAEQQRRAAQRLRFLVVGLLIFLAGAVILSLVAVNERNQAEVARQSEQEARTQAENSLRRANAQRLALESTSLVLNDGDPELAALLALKSLDTEYTPQGDQAVQEAIKQSYPVSTLAIPEQVTVSDIELSEDEQFLAASYSNGSIRVWDLANQNIIASFGNGGGMVKFMDDALLISTNGQGNLTVWNWQTGEQIASLTGLDGYAKNMVTMPERNLIALSSDKGTVLLIDTNTWEIVTELDAQSEIIEGLAVSSDEKWLFTGSNDSQLHQWDMNTLEIIASYEVGGEWIKRVAISPDGNTLAAGTAAGTVWMWQIGTPDEPLHMIPRHANGIPGLAFSPDNTILASGSADTTIRFWDVKSGQETNQFIIQRVPAVDVVWTKDGNTIYASGDDNTIRLWNAAEERRLFNIPSGTHRNPHAFSPDGRYLAAILFTGMTVYDIETGEIINWHNHDQASIINGITYTPDGQAILIGTGNGEVIQLNADTMEIERIFTGLMAPTPDLTLSPDERFLAAGDFIGNFAVWDYQTEEILFTTKYDKPFSAVKFTPDGRYMFEATQSGNLIIRDTDNWESIWELPLGPGWNDIAITSDGQYFAIGEGNGTLRMYTVETQELAHEFVGHRGIIGSVAFSPDDRLLMSGSGDGSARVWDIETGTEIRRIEEGAALHVLFSPDGESIFVGETSSGTIWQLDIQETALTICGLLTRDLTDAERAYYEISDDVPTCGTG